MLRQVLISAAAIALLPLTALADHQRSIEFRPPVGAVRMLCENDTFYGPKGSALILDEKQGVVTLLAPSSGRISICRHERGGYQTLIVFETGRAKASIRRFTNPASFFRIAGRGWRMGMNPIKEILVKVVGTEFTITQLDDRLLVGTDEGTVQVRSGGVDVIASSGKGADLRPGQPPIVFQTDYILAVKNLKVRQEFNQNVVTGELVPGNLINGAQMDGDRFELKNDQPFVVVENARGTGRIIWLPRSVRPFFGH
jgi:hypothetical protein